MTMETAGVLAIAFVTMIILAAAIAAVFGTQPMPRIVHKPIDKSWKRGASLAFALCLLSGVAYAGQRATNSYKTTKLSTVSVLVSCRDEQEPQVRRLENTTMIVVTCK